MKLRYIIPILAFSVTAVSCDFLNLSDPNAVTVGNFYQNEDDIASICAGIYQPFKDTSYFTRQDYFTDSYARVLMFMDPGVSGGENYAFCAHSITNSHSFIASRYNSIYKSIDRCNTLLKHLDDVKYKKVDTRDKYEAQARFVRALGYFYLVTEFGDVPLLLSKPGSVEEVYAANVRQPKEKVYQAIYDDCAWIAKSPLENLQETAFCGRASKVAALVLDAKAHLQQATDPDFKAKKNELLAAAKESLDAAWSKRFFNKLEEIDVTDAFDLATQKGSMENIFQINYVSGDVNNGGSLPLYFAPQSYKDPSKSVVRDATLRNNPCLMREEKAAKIFPEADRAKDLRFINLLGEGGYGGNTVFYTRKYTDRETETAYYGADIVVFRYADVALMMAEVAYHTNDAENAMSWLNMVRQRAGLNPVSGLTGKNLRDAIYEERIREFVGEGKAWEDILRGYSHDEIKTMFQADGATMFSDKDFLFPIPYNQVILNPEGLPQNPGY